MAKNEAVATKESSAVEKKSQIVDLDALTKDLSTKQSNGINLVGETHEWEEGESIRAYVIGKTLIDKIGKPGEKTTAIRMLTEDKRTITVADVLLVGQFETVAEQFEKEKVLRAYEIVNTGWTEGKNGKYRDFRVFELV